MHFGGQNIRKLMLRDGKKSKVGDIHIHVSDLYIHGTEIHIHVVLIGMIH